MCQALRDLMKDEIEMEVEKGFEKGEIKKAIETAKNLTRMGMDIPFIAQALKVSEADVREWL